MKVATRSESSLEVYEEEYRVDLIRDDQSTSSLSPSISDNDDVFVDDKYLEENKGK